jgi:hypothetical protein
VEGTAGNLPHWLLQHGAHRRGGTAVATASLESRPALRKLRREGIEATMAPMRCELLGEGALPFVGVERRWWRECLASKEKWAVVLMVI